MTENTTFPCSRCKTPIAWPADSNQFYAPCLSCGIVNRVPVVVVHHPLRNALLIVFLVILIVAICWTVTVTIGGEMVRPEVGAVLTHMRVGPDMLLYIRAPLPLVVSFRVTGTQEKGGVRIGLSVTKYYLWYFSGYRELPDAEKSPVFSWVWAF